LGSVISNLLFTNCYQTKKSILLFSLQQSPLRPNNLLIEELRRKNGVKRPSLPIISPLNRPKPTIRPNKPPPRQQKNLVLDRNDNIIQQSQTEDDCIYDTPTSQRKNFANPEFPLSRETPSQQLPAQNVVIQPQDDSEQVYDLPPTRKTPQKAVTQTQDDSEQVYDLPPPRKTPQKPVTQMQDDAEQVYDSPPSRKSLLFTEQNAVNQQQHDNEQVYDLPPSRNSLHFTEQNTVTQQQPDTEQVYDLPPPRNTPLSLQLTEQKAVNQPDTEQLYEAPPSRKLLQLSSQTPINQLTHQQQDDIEQVYDLPPARKTPVTSPVIEQKGGFDLYDTVDIKSSENSLYVPARSFEKEEEDIDGTYEVPQKTLPTDFASLRTIEPEGYDTYDVPQNLKKNEEIANEDTYEVPSKLNSPKKDLSSGSLRNAPSNKDITNKSPLKPVGAFNRSLAFDMGRTGKRHSEPVLSTCE